MTRQQLVEIGAIAKAMVEITEQAQTPESKPTLRRLFGVMGTALDGKKKRQIPVRTVVFDREAGEIRGITEKLLQSWRAAYPAISVEDGIRQAKAWLMSHPTNEKKDIPKFLNGWLSRNNAKASTDGSNNALQL